MLLAFALLIAIILGGMFGMLVVKDPGYVLITYGDTAVETSLWVAVTLLVALYIVIRMISFGLRKLIAGQGKVLRWRSGRRVKNARQQTVRGLLLMAEGRWADARKLLLNAADKVETPLINYLNAARAAHEMGEPEARDGYLKRAHETTPGAKFAATLTQAEFQIKDGSYEQALATLLNLRKRAPKHKSVLAMLAHCYEALGDWQALHSHLSDLASHKAVNEGELKRLSRLVWVSLLNESDDVNSLWKKLPKTLKSDDTLMHNWAEHLHKTDADKAEEAIRLILSHHWDEYLVNIYGKVQSTDAARQLLVAQDWGKERPNDFELTVALGRLSLTNQQFEQAREYFEAAVKLSPSDEVYAELGRLCVALGDERRGTDYLLRSLESLPALPQPPSPIIRSPSVA